MSEEITLYKVFIASPNNLRKERRAFRKTLYKYNEDEAIYEKDMFYPVYWEKAKGGIGRPQDEINRELDLCDYMVLVLWDRWGSPPNDIDDEQSFTSASEEEYQRALDNYHNDDFPMKDIVVFFKDVDKQQMNDPGPQLKEVLKFKENLEKNKQVFFKSFENENDFAEIIKRNLGEWLRNHKKGGKKILHKKDWEFSPFQNKHIEHIPFPENRGHISTIDRIISNDYSKSQ